MLFETNKPNYITIRNDISNYLVHFTKGINNDKAFKNLMSILFNMTLKGNNGMIKGKITVFVFLEAPLSSIRNGIANKYYYSKYLPFGIIGTKKWIFNQGGRSV